jgi:hypothetical protein
MNQRISYAVLLLGAALAPPSVSADLIETEVFLDAFGSFAGRLQGPGDTDTKLAPFGSLTRAEVLVLNDRVQGVPFPNLPTTQTRPFASAVATANGFFGVGVSGFFFQNSLPPNEIVAEGAIAHAITNDSGSTVPVTLDFFIPGPTVRFFGVGNSFPPGADPQLDAFARVEIDLSVEIRHRNFTKTVVTGLEYGFQVTRGIPGPFLLPFPTRDGVGLVTRFDEPDGSFGFRLPDFPGPIQATLGPGDTLDYRYDFIAEARTGFGETGVFAAIGDPFNLSMGGGRFDIQVGPAAAIPEPGTLATLGLGLIVLGIFVRRRPLLHRLGGSPTDAL